MHSNSKIPKLTLPKGRLQKMKEALRLMGNGSPHNNRIEQTARGCHVDCVRNRRASDPPGPSLPGRPLRPGSLLIRALYGRCSGPSKRRLGRKPLEEPRSVVRLWDPRGWILRLKPQRVFKKTLWSYRLEWHRPVGAALKFGRREWKGTICAFPCDKIETAA